MKSDKEFCLDCQEPHSAKNKQELHPHYTYTTPQGKGVSVYVVEDCGMLSDQAGGQWHKVLCKPIGFNNAPIMSLDFNKLVRE